MFIVINNRPYILKLLKIAFSYGIFNVIVCFREILEILGSFKGFLNRQTNTDGKPGDKKLILFVSDALCYVQAISPIIWHN